MGMAPLRDGVALLTRWSGAVLTTRLEAAMALADEAMPNARRALVRLAKPVIAVRDGPAAELMAGADPDGQEAWSRDSQGAGG
jgi:hypothetical protein